MYIQCNLIRVVPLSLFQGVLIRGVPLSLFQGVLIRGVSLSLFQGVLIRGVPLSLFQGVLIRGVPLSLFQGVLIRGVLLYSFSASSVIITIIIIKDENKACNEEKRKDMYTSLLKVREQKNKQLQSVYIYILYTCTCM